MIDLLQAVLAVAMVVVIGVWILRRFSGPLLRAEKPEDALEEARAMAVDIGWDELDIERLDRKRAFKRHVERLSEPDVPFAELAQMAHSQTRASPRSGSPRSPVATTSRFVKTS